MGGRYASMGRCKGFNWQSSLFLTDRNIDQTTMLHSRTREPIILFFIDSFRFWHSDLMEFYAISYCSLCLWYFSGKIGKETLPLYLEAVRHFSLANTKCCLALSANQGFQLIPADIKYHSIVFHNFPLYPISWWSIKKFSRSEVDLKKIVKYFKARSMRLMSQRVTLRFWCRRPEQFQ